LNTRLDSIHGAQALHTGGGAAQDDKHVDRIGQIGKPQSTDSAAIVELREGQKRRSKRIKGSSFIYFSWNHSSETHSVRPTGGRKERPPGETN
jgi:hypothetical protein